MCDSTIFWGDSIENSLPINWCGLLHGASESAHSADTDVADAHVLRIQMPPTSAYMSAHSYPHRLAGYDQLHLSWRPWSANPAYTWWCCACLAPKHTAPSGRTSMGPSIHYPLQHAWFANVGPTTTPAVLGPILNRLVGIEAHQRLTQVEAQAQLRWATHLDSISDRDGVPQEWVDVAIKVTPAGAYLCAGLANVLVNSPHMLPLYEDPDLNACVPKYLQDIQISSRQNHQFCPRTHVWLSSTYPVPRPMQDGSAHQHMAQIRADTSHRTDLHTALQARYADLRAGRMQALDVWR